MIELALAIFKYSIAFLFLAFVLVNTLVFAYVGYLKLCHVIKQKRCKHEGLIRETRSCQAECDECDKELGFIGNITDQSRIRRFNGY